jgi:hypothetical protein
VAGGFPLITCRFVHGLIGFFGGGITPMTALAPNSSFGVNIIEVFSNQFRVVLIDFFLMTSNAGTWLLRFCGICYCENNEEENIKDRIQPLAIKAAFIN